MRNRRHAWNHDAIHYVINVNSKYRTNDGGWRRWFWCKRSQYKQAQTYGGKHCKRGSTWRCEQCFYVQFVRCKCRTYTVHTHTSMGFIYSFPLALYSCLFCVLLKQRSQLFYKTMLLMLHSIVSPTNVVPSFLFCVLFGPQRCGIVSACAWLKQM